MSRWGWTEMRPFRADGRAPGWFRTLAAAAPWVTVGLLFAMLWTMAGALTTADGALFDLPRGEIRDVAEVSASALVQRTDQGTLVFFDDTRFVLGDEAQTAALSALLAAKVANRDRPTLLVLADRRVSAGDLMRLADVAKGAGVERTLFAERRREEARE